LRILMIITTHILPMFIFFFSSRRRHTRSKRDWSSDVCSSDLNNKISRLHKASKVSMVLNLHLKQTHNELESRIKNLNKTNNNVSHPQDTLLKKEFPFSKETLFVILFEFNCKISLRKNLYIPQNQK